MVPIPVPPLNWKNAGIDGSKASTIVASMHNRPDGYYLPSPPSREADFCRSSSIQG